LAKYLPIPQEVHIEAPSPLQVKQEESHPVQMPEFAGLIVVPAPQAHIWSFKGYPPETPQ